jgi:hypothetical protein
MWLLLLLLMMMMMMKQTETSMAKKTQVAMLLMTTVPVHTWGLLQDQWHQAAQNEGRMMDMVAAMTMTMLMMKKHQKGILLR